MNIFSLVEIYFWIKMKYFYFGCEITLNLLEPTNSLLLMRLNSGHINFHPHQISSSTLVWITFKFYYLLFINYLKTLGN
jgi:hypothetical protein